jgi:hypothetical protein
MLSRFSKPDDVAHALLNLGTMWIKLSNGSMPEAIRHFGLAAAVNPTWEAPYLNMAKIFIGRNADLLKTNRLFYQLEHTEQAATVSVLRELADVKVQQGQDELSVASRIQGEVSRYCLGIALSTMGQHEASTAVYREVINTGQIGDSNFKTALVLAAAGAVQRDHDGGEAVAVIAMATETRQELKHMLYSAQLSGHAKVHVLGMDQEYKGNSMKIDLYMQFLEKVDPEQIVLAIDAYDVLLFPAAASSLLLERFVSFGRPIVFSAEARCWPDDGVKPMFAEVAHQRRRQLDGVAGGDQPIEEPPFPYLNSGGIIGVAKYMLAMLKTVRAYPSCFVSDQVRDPPPYPHARVQLVVCAVWLVYLAHVVSPSVLTTQPRACR